MDGGDPVAPVRSAVPVAPSRRAGYTFPNLAEAAPPVAIVSG